jgi:peptide/nickel transport system permease protein
MFTRINSTALGSKLAKSLLAFILTLIVGGLGTATMVRLSPGSTSDEELLDARLGTASQTAIRAQHDSESNVVVFYMRYLKGMFRGDFGFSRSMRLPISDLLATRMAVTANLLGLGITGGWLLAMALAVAVTLERTPYWSAGAAIVTGLLQSVPSGVLALLVFYYGGPIRVIVALVLFPKIFQYARNIIGQARMLPHVLAARARGLSQGRVFMWHVMPAALPQLLAFAGVSVSMAIGAAIPIEVICDLPGVGQLAWKAALARDLPLLVALTFLVAAFTQFGNLLSDCAIAVSTRRTA